MSAGGEITLVGAPAWHTMSAEDVLREQGVDAEQGLAAAEVTARRTTFGANRFAEQQPEPRGGRSCASTRTRCRSCCWSRAS